MVDPGHNEDCGIMKSDFGFAAWVSHDKMHSQLSVTSACCNEQGAKVHSPLAFRHH